MNFPSGDQEGASRTSSEAAKCRTLVPSAFITYSPFRPCRLTEKHIRRPSGDTAAGAITPPSLLRHSSTVSSPWVFHRLWAPPFDERNTTYCGRSEEHTSELTGSGKRRTSDSSTIRPEIGSVQSSSIGLATDATSRVARPSGPMAAETDMYWSTPKVTRCGILCSTSMAYSQNPEPSSAVAE